jgi:type IX secretion system PorP/SprF family membrane protein
MNKLSNIFKMFFTCIGLLSFAGTVRGQQGLSYTQNIDNQTPINSTFSLLQPYGSVNTLVRKQWAGIEGAPTTYLVNGNAPIKSINGTVGFIVENDVFAVEHLTEANLFFAKGIRLSDNQNLAVSINAGFRNYAANYSGIDASDPVFRDNIQETRPNVGFGVMYYTRFYYVGLSLPELNIRTLGNASVEDNTNFTNHYYLTAGTGSQVNEDYKFKYAAVLSYSKDVPVLADVSTMLYVKDVLGIGVNYKTDKEAAGMFSINYNMFHVGYAYQFGTSSTNIGGFSNATHEVTVGIRFGKGSIIEK